MRIAGWYSIRNTDHWYYGKVYARGEILKTGISSYRCQRNTARTLEENIKTAASIRSGVLKWLKVKGGIKCLGIEIKNRLMVIRDLMVWRQISPLPPAGNYF